nr:quinolinate synthase, chloroplastic [Quercus suber]
MSSLLCKRGPRLCSHNNLRCCSRSCIHVPSQGSCSFISFACYICKHLGRIKARAHELTPTITCTSSNAVQTILKGFLYYKFEHTIWT